MANQCADPKCRHVWARHIRNGFCDNVDCRCEGWTETWPVQEEEGDRCSCGAIIGATSTLHKPGCTEPPPAGSVGLTNSTIAFPS